MPTKWVKTFEQLFEQEEIRPVGTFSEPEQTDLETSQSLENAGILQAGETEGFRKKLLKKQKAQIRKMYKEEDPIASPKDLTDWESSKFGKAIPEKLARALTGETMAKLRKKGFLVEPMTLEQLINGNVILSVRGADSKIGLFGSSSMIRRITKGGSTLLKNYSTDEVGDDFYQVALSYVDVNIDPTDPNLATYRGAEIKKDRLAFYENFKTELRKVYETVVNPKLASAIYDRVFEVNQNRFSEDSVLMTGKSHLAYTLQMAKLSASKGIIYLETRSYDHFFTRELENAFVEYNVRWTNTPCNLFIGSIMHYSERRWGIFYSAMVNYEPPVFLKGSPHHSPGTPRICYIEVDGENVSPKLIELLHDKASETEEAYPESEVRIKIR